MKKELTPTEKILKTYTEFDLHSVRSVSEATGYSQQKVSRTFSDNGIALNATQKAVIELWEKGYSANEIAKNLEISEKTVCSYLPRKNSPWNEKKEIPPELELLEKAREKNCKNHKKIAKSGKIVGLEKNLDDYSRGIMHATAYKVCEECTPYLVARNRDPWPISYLAKILNKNPYFSKSGQTYCVKCNGIREKPQICEITDKRAFIRAYVEIHGVLDLTNRKKSPKLRLRIFGNAEIIEFINCNLPAGRKKVQHISNKIDGGKYIGETEAIYYQSRKEILAILEWLDGTPKNVRVWEDWKSICLTRSN